MLRLIFWNKNGTVWLMADGLKPSTPTGPRRNQESVAVFKLRFFKRYQDVTGLCGLKNSAVSSGWPPDRVLLDVLGVRFGIRSGLLRRRRIDRQVDLVHEAAVIAGDHQRDRIGDGVEHRLDLAVLFLEEVHEDV